MTSSPTRRSLAWVVLAALAIGSGMFSEPMGIASGDAFRDNDWLNCRSFDVHSRVALLEHGQFPLRSHLLGGGFPTIAHPSDGSWAPTLLAVLLFGDVIGVKINLLLLLVLGGWGLLGLARHAGASEGGARFAAGLFVLSGWLPSMLLVGFYNQAFFLLAPAAARLLLDQRPRSLLLAGGLLAVVLQQGGHAFPATCYFLGLVAWFEACRGRLGLGLGILLCLVAPRALGNELATAWPALLGLGAAVGILLSPWGRELARRLLPWGARLALVLAVACSLGAARIVGLDFLDAQGGSYEHRLVRTGATWFPDTDGPSLQEERFYEDVPAFLASLWSRVPAEGSYGTTWGRVGDPLAYEYSYLGLTPVGIALLLIGLLLAVRREEGRPWALLFVLFAGICFGWQSPIDLHFLLTWGVPFLDSFSQPLKYWNFFVLLPACVLAGLAADRALGRCEGHARRAVGVGLGALLLWPLLQNRSAFEDTFASPVSVPSAGALASVDGSGSAGDIRPARGPGPAAGIPPAGGFAPVALVADAGWLAFDEADIRAMSSELFLRDYGRPAAATEYVNLQRNVGTVDHYGSVVLPEVTVPARYITLDGAELDNPRYPGEAWLEGPGIVHAVRLRPNDIEVDVETANPTRLVINQAWLAGFVATEGAALQHPDGFLALDLLQTGRRTVRLAWRPVPILAGLAASALSFLVWLGALGVLWRRE